MQKIIRRTVWIAWFCGMFFGACQWIYADESALNAFQLDYRIEDARESLQGAKEKADASRGALEDARDAGKDDAEQQRLQSLTLEHQNLVLLEKKRVEVLQENRADARKKLPAEVASAQVSRSLLQRNTAVKVLMLSVALRNMQQEELDANNEERQKCEILIKKLSSPASIEKSLEENASAGEEGIRQMDLQSAKQRIIALRADRMRIMKSLHYSSLRIDRARRDIVQVENDVMKREREQALAKDEELRMAESAQAERKAIRLARETVRQENEAHEKTMQEVRAMVRTKIEQEQLSVR